MLKYTEEVEDCPRKTVLENRTPTKADQHYSIPENKKNIDRVTCF